MEEVAPQIRLTPVEISGSYDITVKLNTENLLQLISMLTEDTSEVHHMRICDGVITVNS